LFATVGSHPEYVRDISSDEIEVLVHKMIQNAPRITAVGEAGLDYY
jgi:Tat protein secretion system quality control protein TatD with DNase activity